MFYFYFLHSPTILVIWTKTLRRQTKKPYWQSGQSRNHSRKARPAGSKNGWDMGTFRCCMSSGHFVAVGECDNSARESDTHEPSHRVPGLEKHTCWILCLEPKPLESWTHLHRPQIRSPFLREALRGASKNHVALSQPAEGTFKQTSCYIFLMQFPIKP